MLAFKLILICSLRARFSARWFALMRLEKRKGMFATELLPFMYSFIYFFFFFLRRDYKAALIFVHRFTNYMRVKSWQYIRLAALSSVKLTKSTVVYMCIDPFGYIVMCLHSHNSILFFLLFYHESYTSHVRNITFSSFSHFLLLLYLPVNSHRVY